MSQSQSGHRILTVSPEKSSKQRSQFQLVGVVAKIPACPRGHGIAGPAPRGSSVDADGVLNSVDADAGGGQEMIEGEDEDGEEEEAGENRDLKMPEVPPVSRVEQASQTS